MNKTCSIYRYWKPDTDGSDDGECLHDQVNALIWTPYQQEGLYFKANFGCIFHADKEKKEDKIMKTEISTELLHHIFDMATSMAASGFVVEQRQSCAQQICDSLHPILFADKEQPEATAPHADESDPYEEQLDREFAVWLTKHNFPADLPEHCLKPLRTAALLVSGFEFIKEQSLPAFPHLTFPKPGDEELRKFWEWLSFRGNVLNNLEPDAKRWYQETHFTIGYAETPPAWLLERYRRETEQ